MSHLSGTRRVHAERYQEPRDATRTVDPQECVNIANSLLDVADMSSGHLFSVHTQRPPMSTMVKTMYSYPVRTENAEQFIVAMDMLSESVDKVQHALQRIALLSPSGKAPAPTGHVCR